MKSPIVSIQILRGIAAFLVVVAHVIEHPLAVPPNAALITGLFGVEIFFVVSGFVIAHIAREGVFDPVVFVVRRTARVVPLYWIATFVVFALAAAAPSVFRSTVADADQLLHSLVFVPSRSPVDPLDWRPVLKLGWTLEYEMFFYAAMAALFWCRTSRLRAVLITAAFAPLVALSFLIEPRSSILAVYANFFLVPFVCGVWLSELARSGFFGARGDARPRALAWTASAALLATIVLYSGTFVSDDVASHLPMTVAAVLVVATGLFTEAWAIPGRLTFFRVLGDASYSLYLTHMFVVGAGVAVLHRVPDPSLWVGIAFGIAEVVGSLVLAVVCWRWIERPSIAWGHRFGAHSRSLVADRARPRHP